MFRKVEKKTIAAIAAEWDALAPIRYQQIVSGVDLTFKHVLAPALLSLASAENADTVVDAGCGVGILTNLLAAQTREVVGVDPSPESISIARAHFGRSAGFFLGTLETYAANCRAEADLIVANMVLMDVLDLDSFIKSAHRLLRPGGAFIFSTTHPWFWPVYYGYVDEPWFKYEEETVFESPFRISAHPNVDLFSTQVHRPLENYVNSIVGAQFAIERLYEPMPTAEIDARYPEPWRFPRYLLGVCRRQ
ncbi:class I SAM-dependent methyltransferase [Tardiphaga sp. P9-11]|jgi:2-polyprenyl-3-methyl-5-hydroxy-6-metoxy-1,4-benzoquinol methylase|uniref:class I SAM-dependent methyltransferase n=1 Tax=Tardiphaga sp. P9-11 TaxID=2024614 RepID=UPI0011F1EE48|nr:class I SAM-dependent methyltransferase [Tardiphaga sp. P9-11]KAA0074550.1 methyltransferase domain-containing protein [Tardiphaga sp. P9-11]